jgi:hypothetical protein
MSVSFAGYIDWQKLIPWNRFLGFLTLTISGSEENKPILFTWKKYCTHTDRLTNSKKGIETDIHTDSLINNLGEITKNK